MRRGAVGGTIRPMLRWLWQLWFAGAWCVALFCVVFPLMLLWPTRRNRLVWACRFSRWWSRGVLWAGGVRLEVEGAERLALCPAVFTFNHASTLDFVVNAAIAPETALVFGKAELARVPFIGWIWWLSGHPMIRRDQRGQWQQLLDSVAVRLASGQHTTIVAPEGTRNRQGGLLPFKKGPVHLAIQARVPIVPWVIHDIRARIGERGLLPGVIRLRILPPIDTRGWRPETVDEHVADLRRLYLEALGLPLDEPAAGGAAAGAALAGTPPGGGA